MSTAVCFSILSPYLGLGGALPNNKRVYVCTIEPNVSFFWPKIAVIL